MKTIAIISGGFSEEAAISFKSAETVASTISKELWNAYTISITEDGWKAIVNNEQIPINRDDFSFKLNGETVTFDVAFITIHGTPGEDGILQGYFDLLGLPYTTADHVCTALTFNKYYCNGLLKQLGFNCAKSVVLWKDTPWSAPEIVDKLGLPCFVKPNDGGSSFGVTKVKSEADLAPAIAEAFKHGTGAMIESFMDGTEVSCGIFRTKKGITVLPLTEIVTENEFFDYQAKYEGASQEITPARIDDSVRNEVQRITKSIFQQLGMKGMARADFILIDKVPYLIEINTTPGLSAESIIPQMIRAAGLDVGQVFDDLITACLTE